jgi:hypothetical protein
MISYWSILKSIGLISLGIWSFQLSKETQKLLQKTEDSYQHPTPEKQKQNNLSLCPGHQPGKLSNYN